MIAPVKEADKHGILESRSCAEEPFMPAGVTERSWAERVSDADYG